MKRYPVKGITRCVGLLFVILMAAAGQVFAQGAEQTREVSFKTEDGWTIYGTYYLPQGDALEPAAGLLVLAEPDTSPRRLGGNISRAVAQEGMAALTIDLRGNAGSYGKKDYQVFSPEERDAIQMDIRAAIRFLSSRKEVDGRRIGIFGPSGTADYVVREAARNVDQVKAVVLSTPVLTDKGRQSIRSRKDMPVLAIASNDDPRNVQQTSAEPFFLSESRDSRLIFVIDRGANIFNRPGHPTEKVTGWLKENLKALGTQTEVSIKTADGKTLWGLLYKPEGLKPGERVPGVVFVHGANHDATTWFPLAREVTRAGMAALTFDQRGYRKSHNEGMMGENIEADVRAAVDFLSSRNWVDPDSIGLMTATSRSGPTVVAASGDRRIRTLAALSFYGGTEESNRALSNMDIPVFLVASVNDMNADGRSLDVGTREAYSLSKNKDSMLLMYDSEGGRGSTMLRLKPELVGMLSRWFGEKLAK